jgi:hypothetical protein
MFLEYRNASARVLDLPYNQPELSINIGVAAALYKKLATATDGYAGDVPITHRGKSRDRRGIARPDCGGSDRHV